MKKYKISGVEEADELQIISFHELLTQLELRGKNSIGQFVCIIY